MYQVKFIQKLDLISLDLIPISIVWFKYDKTYVWIELLT